jgi:hypothetical protein
LEQYPMEAGTILRMVAYPTLLDMSLCRTMLYLNRVSQEPIDRVPGIPCGFQFQKEGNLSKPDLSRKRDSIQGKVGKQGRVKEHDHSKIEHLL